METFGDDVWLGIDLGTQSVRAVAVADDGQVLGSASRPLTSRRDGDRHEQDPQEWWTAVGEACREVLCSPSGAGDQLAGRVRGVAVDATSGTVLLLDRAGRPLTPGLMYDDRRAGGWVDRVNEVGGALWAALGYQRMQAVWALPKALWLVHDSGADEPGARVVHQSDLVNERLVGAPVATDPSSALKTGADLLRTCWPEPVLAALGLEPSRLPDLVAPAAVLGQVCPSAAEWTGIPVGTPVVASLTDGCASQLGAGCTSPGSWNSVLGTTLVLKGVSTDLLRDPTGAVYSHRSPDGGWLPGGASSTGAGTLARDFAGHSLEDLTEQAATRPPTSVVHYPLAGVGERFPFVAPQARAFTLGSPQDTVEGFQAVLQTVAYLERLAYEHLRGLGASTDGPLVLTGGGSRNEVWNQLRADVLGRPVTLPVQPEPALGMAVLAAAAVRGRTVAETAARLVHVREVVEPRSQHRQAFDDGYGRFVAALLERGWLEQERSVAR